MEIDTAQKEYFESYENLEVHKLMIEDHARTNAYRQAILNNNAYFKDKVVMDVGCGTGILSIFCAQAGAKKVYAVEASSIAELAKEIVKENNFEDVIEVIHSRVEDVVLPNDIKVDAIVSEWMGFYLLHEGMLDSVLVARDRFLKEGGEMFPETAVEILLPINHRNPSDGKPLNLKEEEEETAVIYIAPCSIPTLYDTWGNIHGVSMNSFSKHLRDCRYNRPEIVTVPSEDLLASEVAMCWINLKEEKVSDLDYFTIRHVFSTKKKGRYQGICVWFECTFPELSEGREASQVVLRTGPQDVPTHWKQTVIVLPQDQEVEVDEPVAFQLDMVRDKNSPRRYTLELQLIDPDKEEHPLPCSCYMTKCILIKTYMLEHPEKNPKQIEANANPLEEDMIDDDNLI